MRYCTRCKRIFSNDDLTACPSCSRTLIDNPSHYSPVHIVTANGFELERIKAALTEHNIPFTVSESKADAGIQILNAAPAENSDVIIPLSFYHEASDLLIGIGAMQEAEELSADDEKKLLDAREKEAGEMSPQKRFWVKLLSAIAFVGILAAVVWLADIIGHFINPYFT